MSNGNCYSGDCSVGDGRHGAGFAGGGSNGRVDDAVGGGGGGGDTGVGGSFGCSRGTLSAPSPGRRPFFPARQVCAKGEEIAAADSRSTKDGDGGVAESAITQQSPAS